MANKIDIIGQKFGLLTVIELLYWKRWSYYICKCECGVLKKIRIDHLRSGKTISCGCEKVRRSIKASTKHGLSSNPLCFVWYSMMNRCYNESFLDYNNYGGRGIRVSPEWHDVKVFIKDVSQGYSKGLELDRIKNDEWYSKSNFKWSTHKENNRNKRTNRHIVINGIDKLAIEWAEENGVIYTTLLGRSNRGWKNDEILYGKK